MRNRILEISEQPARLRIERRQLVVDTEHQAARFPLEDLAVLIVAHPQVSYTQAVLTEVASSGGIFITCDRSRMPIGMLLPLSGHTLQSRRFQQQLSLSVPKQKQAWKQIIQSKIAMQADLLKQIQSDDGGLLALVSQVRSGDPANVEARAARMYWNNLFGSDFRRDRDAADHNRLLNYGYAVLRAAVARAIVAAGLHPSIGIHHHNQYNAYCLADDLIEPYRPLVDLTVHGLIGDQSDEVPELDQLTRAALLQTLTGHVWMQGEQRTLFDAIARTASSLGQLIMGESRELSVPEGIVYASP